MNCRFIPTIHMAVVGFSLTAFSSCATLTGPKRTFTFSGAGAVTGAVAGTALSPNAESRGLNGLVFGLVGALLGGAASVLTDKSSKAPPEEPKFFDSSTQALSGKEITIAPHEALPDYVRKRLQPMVIEEFIETDQVDEDGILREAHKAYRIKRQPEFNPRPLSEAQESPGKEIP